MNDVILTDGADTKSIMEKISMVIRAVTVPPVIAFFMLSYLFWAETGVFVGFYEYAVAVGCLCLLPSKAYIVHFFIKDKFPGQEGKRTLAMIFSVVGYGLGLTSAVVMGSSTKLVLIYLGYLLSGVIILFLSKGAKFKISGHAVGSAGPIAILLGFGQWVWIFGLPVIISVIYSSLKIKRHTAAQIICGVAQPFIVFVTLTSIVGI